MKAGHVLPQLPDFFLTLLPPPCSTSPHLFVCCLYSYIAPTPYISCVLGLRQFIQSPTPNSCDSRAVSTTQQACWCQCAQISPLLTADMGFLASCRSQLSWVRAALCARWKVLHAAASRGWVPCKCPWEWGDQFTLQNYYSTQHPRQPNGGGRLAFDFSRNELLQHSSQKQSQKRWEYTSHLYWRPKSLLETHQSVLLFFRCWAQQSKRRNSSLGYSLSLPSSCGSRPATDCRPLRWSRTLLGVEYAGTSQSQDWGTVAHP